MTKLLLAEGFWGGLWEKLSLLFQTYNFWIAMGVAMLGVALLVLARRMARVHEGHDEIPNNNKVYLTYKILSCVCVLTAVIILIFFC